MKTKQHAKGHVVSLNTPSNLQVHYTCTSSSSCEHPTVSHLQQVNALVMGRLGTVIDNISMIQEDEKKTICNSIECGNIHLVQQQDVSSDVKSCSVLHLSLDKLNNGVALVVITVVMDSSQ